MVQDTIFSDVSARGIGRLAERYRPARWSEVVGQDAAIKRIAAIGVSEGLGGQAYWITGQSGTGKTTIAYLLAAELADALNVCELNAEELTPARIRTMRDSSRLAGLGVKTGRAYIINESHGLDTACIRQFLTMFEEDIPLHVCWIFTTTNAGDRDLFGEKLDASPFRSRCKIISLARRGLCGLFAARARQIAQETGADGKDISAYETLVKHHKNNLRAVLQDIGAGYMKG